MLNYSYPLYRPPSEAENIIIQATYGCSYNRCSFCSMYKSKKYMERGIGELYREIDTLARVYPNARKVFLADGDALALGTDYLLDLLRYLKGAFCKLSRVSLYASSQNLLEKSEDELRLLRENGLTLIYFGIETGSDKVLKKITKGVTSQEMITSLNKASSAGLKISATVILGIGGEVHTHEHIDQTAAIINATTLNYLSTLQLGLDEQIEEKFYKHFGDFKMLNDDQVLQEQQRLLAQLNPPGKVIFRSNHASNALHLAGTLPKDKARLVREVEAALAMGEAAFVPKVFRGF